MTAEQLLKPRYKVVIEFPMGKYSKGDIIEGKKAVVHYGTDEGENDEYDLSSYPKIFRPLEWWEDRTENELPKYVKAKSGGRVAILRDIPENESSRWCMYLDSESIPYDPNGFEPATKDEYDLFLQNV